MQPRSAPPHEEIRSAYLREESIHDLLGLALGEDELHSIPRWVSKEDLVPPDSQVPLLDKWN